jgi:hypothetical protein
LKDNLKRNYEDENIQPKEIIKVDDKKNTTTDKNGIKNKV